MSFPQDPEATSVISWNKPEADGDVGRHHVDDIPAAGTAPEPTLVPFAPVNGGSHVDGEILPAVTGEAVTCPECGTASHVTLNRREALDFCRNCDYPLFWAPQKILRGTGEQHDDSLRRLPGQSGRVSVASLPCPHCSEPNAINAVVCIRCGQDMHPVAAPAPVMAPRVYVPPPAPEPEPERGVPAWVWVMIAVGIAAVVAFVVLIVTGTIHF